MQKARLRDSCKVRQSRPQLLCAAAERLKLCMRETYLVARFGGDEFAVLRDDVENPHSAESLATKISEAMAARLT